MSARVYSKRAVSRALHERVAQDKQGIGLIPTVATTLGDLQTLLAVRTG